MTKDEQDFLAWKAERDERNRKSGGYWITPEGRAHIRSIYADYLDGNTVLPLLNALERSERTAGRLAVLAIKHCPSDHHDFPEICQVFDEVVQGVR